MVKWNAVDYARNSTAQLGWARELIGKLGLAGNERVLDIGCGDGKVSAEIARIVSDGEVVGVDLSEDMVSLASASFSRTEWPNLRFARAHASDLHFRAEFDVVFSNATLHWVKDHRPVLRGIRRALQPGGRALLQMGGRGNAAEILRLVDDFRTSGKWACYFTDFQSVYGFYGPEDYIPWLKEAGLQPVRVELIPKDMEQQGKECLAGWFRTTWLPYTQCVPEHLREEFVGDVVDAYTDRFPPDGNGVVHVEMVRLEVEATRQASRSALNGMWILG